MRCCGASVEVYQNRLLSIITIVYGKIVHWRDYVDSLAAWNALTKFA